MTDLKIAGKKIYVFPANMEFLHDFPKLGEPEPVVEEAGNGAEVKEVCCYTIKLLPNMCQCFISPQEPPSKKRKVEVGKEDEDANGEEESEDEDEDEGGDDEDEDEEDENDEGIFFFKRYLLFI